MGRDIIPL